MKTVSLLLSLFFALQFSAQTKAEITEASNGAQYGAGVSEDLTYDVYSPEGVVKALDDKDSLKNIIIQANVTEVCTKKGCWMTLQNAENKTIFVKMKDYAFFVPQSMVGKKVLIHGDVTKKVTPVAELRHYAEDAKKTKQEVEAITVPKTEYRVLAIGIKII